MYKLVFANALWNTVLVTYVLVRVALDALVPINVNTVVLKFASSPNAVASSSRVLSVVGALLTNAAIEVSTYDSVAKFAFATSRYCAKRGLVLATYDWKSVFVT